MAFVFEQVLFDFARAADREGWRPVDDVVMGGRSHSTIAFDAGALVFSGELSLEKGGGFASIRSPLCDFDISSGTAVVLRGRGDGKTYKLGLRLEEAFDAPVYQASFVAPERLSGEILIPFHELEPRYHGRRLEQAPPFDPHRVRSVGVLIGDRQAGPFKVALESIAVR